MGRLCCFSDEELPGVVVRLIATDSSMWSFYMAWLLEIQAGSARLKHTHHRNLEI